MDLKIQINLHLNLIILTHLFFFFVQLQSTNNGRVLYSTKIVREYLPFQLIIYQLNGIFH